MTELERARKHLSQCQAVLAFRRNDPISVDFPCVLRQGENGVLAALSWVWEEQEKDRIDAAANPRLIIGAP